MERRIGFDTLKLFERTYQMKDIIILLCIIVPLKLNAQSFTPYSQFHINKVLYNPAAVGSEDQIRASMFVRKEWSTFPGTPHNNLLLADLPVNLNRMGIGIRVGNESIVASNIWDAHLMYAYKINLAKGKLSFGMNVGFQRYQFDPNKIAIQDEDDVLLSSKHNAVYPNLGFGMLFMKNRFFIGASALSVLKHPDNSFLAESTNSFVNRNFILNTSNTWKTSRDTKLEATILASYNFQKNPLICASFIGNYREKIYVGTNVRSNKSMAIILGIKLDKVASAFENMCLGYSYDVNFSSLNRYLNNTHEVTLNISFDKPKSIPKERQKPVEISPYDL